MSVARSIFLAAVCVAAAASEAVAGGVLVPMDNVTVVAFKTPVATVYVGNPSVAEITMIDSRHAFLLGKTFGTTNLIALDKDKTVIVNDSVTVSDRRAGAVTVYRGANTYNYSCTTMRCETRPLPGDPQPYFANTEAEASQHEDTGAKAANTGGQTQH